MSWGLWVELLCGKTGVRVEEGVHSGALKRLTNAAASAVLHEDKPLLVGVNLGLSLVIFQHFANSFVTPFQNPPTALFIHVPNVRTLPVVMEVLERPLSTRRGAPRRRRRQWRYGQQRCRVPAWGGGGRIGKEKVGGVGGS